MGLLRFIRNSCRHPRGERLLLEGPCFLRRCPLLVLRLWELLLSHAELVLLRPFLALYTPTLDVPIDEEWL